MANRITQMLANRIASKTAQTAIATTKGGEMRTLPTYRTEISTYFTEPSTGQQLMYSAENWVRLKLTLETAGPVSVGSSDELAPLFSGKGRLLDTGVEYEFYLARGTRLYISSETVNRISMTVEPIPWMEQISSEIISVAQIVSSTVQQVGNAIVNALSTISGRSAPTVAPQQMKDMPTMVLPKTMAARLTPVVPSKRTR